LINTRFCVITMRRTGLVDYTVTVHIGGEAGQSISRSGMLLGKSMMRGGFYAYGAINYPSLIRGGHNFYTVRASSRKVHSLSGRPDLNSLEQGVTPDASRKHQLSWRNNLR